MASEQFSLCWDNFHKNMSAGMNMLLENEEMVDVTLAVEGKTLKAHKMVLSVCSPYFKELFKSNPCQHPIVFMKDVSYVAVSDLLQFMYQGEVQVSQENLTTFIKTAEALQIKGLTGDGNGSTDTDLLEPEEKVVKVQETYKPGPKSKKQASSAASSAVSTPAAKRPRLSSQTETPATTSTITASKVEPATPTTSANANASSSSDFVQFKMEPYDQTQSFTVPDDSNDDNFGDDTIDESVDDNEDYSLMESTDEPQAGTSMDGAGEGQDEKAANRMRRKRQILKVVHNGFSYHTSVVRKDNSLRYLICAQYNKCRCLGRAILAVGADIHELKVTQPHNHPPDDTLHGKTDFYSELKLMAERAPINAPLRSIYESAIRMYPEFSITYPFSSVRTSMRRWRNKMQESPM